MTHKCIQMSTDLLEEVPHLGVFDLESLQLLVDSLVSLQLFKSGPLTVQVGAEEGTPHTQTDRQTGRQAGRQRQRENVLCAMKRPYGISVCLEALIRSYHFTFGFKNPLPYRRKASLDATLLWQ